MSHHVRLGEEVAYNDDTHALRHAADGGPNANESGAGSAAPPATLVGINGGLQFDLIWDSSVANAPGGFAQDVIHSATYLASLFPAPEIINVHVGWGEINGQPLTSGTLGESQTNGYLENYATVAHLVGSGNLQASNEPTNAQFFISSAQAKAAGLVSPSMGIDGYVGFGTLGQGYSWNMTYGSSGTDTPTGSTQYDLQGVVQHELTEVMGRTSMEGLVNFNGQPTYTALDLFDYKSAGVLNLSGSGGYYSNDGGVTDLGNFNGSAHDGDIADWASYLAISQAGTAGLLVGDQDALNAFTWNGIASNLSHTDVQVMHSIGFPPEFLA
jgi:hypothetical protein